MPDSDCWQTCGIAATCDDPINLYYGVHFGATTGLAGAHVGSCSSGTAPEAIGSFTVAETTTVCMHTLGSTFDTALFVRTACADAGSQVTCDDDSAGNLLSVVQFEAQGGTEYFVFVDGYGTNSGEFLLSILEGACQ